MPDVYSNQRPDCGPYGQNKRRPCEDTHSSLLDLVPENGVEPSRPCGHRILSPARLPVPPLGHIRQDSTNVRRGSTPARCTANTHPTIWGSTMEGCGKTITSPTAYTAAGKEKPRHG